MDRSVGRVTLAQPITAVACGERVQIVDASLRGVRVRHRSLLSDRDRCSIAFDWNGKAIEFVGRVRWTKLQRDSSRKEYQSGLEIAAIDEPSIATLRNLIESCVERALEEQKANAQGIPPAEQVREQTGRTPLYSRHELVHGIWRKSTTTDPRQPHSGFTVPIEESPQQVELLRAAYAAADAPLREMIQRLAELNIANPDAAFTRRYTP